jgi:hypothetical protein
VFVANVVHVALANQGVFTCRHAQDVTTQHITRGWMGSHPPPVLTQIAHRLFPFWLGYYFGLQDVKVAFYVWGDPIFTIMTCFPFYSGFGFDLSIF